MGSQRAVAMAGLWLVVVMGGVANGAAAEKPVRPGTAPIARDSASTVKSATPSRVKIITATHPGRRYLTYTLVSKPKHGTVTMPKKHWRTRGNIYAYYTSDRDYVGKDSFTWKVNDGVADSGVATCSVVVTATPPVLLPQATACVIQGKSVDIPASYSGGGGYAYTIKHSKPGHGALIADGTTLRYTPDPKYTGTDSFTWHMEHSKEKGAAVTATKSRTCWVVVKKAGMTDWPQWRADEWRSGFTSMSLPAKLHLQWRRDIPATASPFAARGKHVYPDVDYCRPVQLGKTLFVPVTASDSLSAYHTDTGKLRWRFYASGVVRRPPVAIVLAGGKAAVIFGSDDGWVYCLNAADGSVRWKFRAAPNNRKAMGFGRLSSVWPIWSSPVVSRGKVYFVAGYIPSFGLYSYCLDAATGSIVWVNDGRLTDIWNASTFGPLALSYDNAHVYGAVEGASRPWVLDSASGKYLGHYGVGYQFPGSGNQRGRDTKSNGSCGWYVDGKGSFNVPEPMSITVGTQAFTPERARALGVTGTVASLLAGDGKLFVTTAEGGIYCFGGKQTEPAVYAHKTTPLPDVSDSSTAAAKTMLSRDDLKQGLALVLGIKDGRLVEELAKQSSLMIVAVDADHKKLQALRARMDAAGLSGARVSTLEGNPMGFAFAPYQAALITSEKGLADGRTVVEKLYRYTRPFGGEIWLPTSDAGHAALVAAIGASKNMPLSEVARENNFTQVKRTGLPDGALRIKPPFGLIAFGSDKPLAASSPLHWVWKNRDLYTGLPLKGKSPGYVPPLPKENANKGYPTASSVSTSSSVFSSMVNPLYSTMEKFAGLPSSGNDGSCTAIWCRYGDIGLTHGKISSFFDTSSHYWGRLFFPEAGGCPGHMFLWNGILINTATPVPGSTCGCSAAMQFTNFALAPMEHEENWVNYQSVRTSRPIEEDPIRRVGINFGAPGDRYVAEDKMLWTHHPYSGRYGRCSYNFESMIEAPPLVPVSYSGKAESVYHHSAQMEKTKARYRGWVSASYVKGMSEITVPLAQSAVALRARSAPKVDGNLNDKCWDGQQRLVFAANKVVIDRDRMTGLPKIDDHCYAMLRYDDTNLYVAAGVHVEYGPPTSWRADTRRRLTVTLNSREGLIDDLVLTGAQKTYRGKTTPTKTSTGIDPGAWSYAGGTTSKVPYTAEIAIPWKALAAAGLWKDQLVVNISVSGGGLTGSKFVAQCTPLYLDKVRGLATSDRPHTVRLYFAEMESKVPGQRVFDVSLQGKVALAGLDVVKEAGGAKRELVKEFKNVRIANALSIGFKSHAGEPMLSGVEIIGASPAKTLAPNAAPAAVIDASALSGPAPLAVTFSARKSSDPDGQVAQCAWETGDGRLAKGSELRHVYAEPGTYKVHLLVRDNRGAMATKTATVKVTVGAPAAFVCTIRAKGGDYTTLSAWEAAMRSDLTAAAKSRLFKAKRRGNYAATDDGKTVTFTGGGTGALKHINGSDIAYVTNCAGTVKPGVVKCASGNTFDVADAGHPVYSIVAECYNDWPGGLVDNLKSPGSGWTTDPLRCVTIRAAAGQAHKGRAKGAKGVSAGFTLKGVLDLTGVPHTRVERVIIDAASTLSLGVGASVNRVVAGPIRLAERGMMANTVGTTLTAFSTKGVANRPVSSYTINLRDGRKQAKPPKLVSSHISFYNCTATTFDPGNQVGVEFINCLAAPGGKGFHDARYSEPAYANHCVSTDGTATRWDPGDGTGGNTVAQPVKFRGTPGGDFHLAPSDEGARSRGAPGLGADIDGDERVGPRYDVGADTVGRVQPGD
jgi:outer membrane protein assembly factor BamB/PKD repeat protein